MIFHDMIFQNQGVSKSYNLKQSPTILEFDTEDQVLFLILYVLVPFVSLSHNSIRLCDCHQMAISPT